MDNENKGDQHPEGWNELSELTLSVMANRSKYDKCKKTLANTKDTVQDSFRKEKLYYKDRILNMTRDLFHERCENDTVNDAHQEYIKTCIEYLKWNDITDMVSEDKRTEVRNDNLNDIIQARNELQQKITSLNEEPDQNVDYDDDNTVSSPPPSPPPPPPSQTPNLMSIANKMCIRKKTIDDFIVLKPRTDNENDINKRLPKVRDYQTEITKRVDASAERLGM